MTVKSTKASKYSWRSIAIWIAAITGALVIGYGFYSGPKDGGIAADPKDATQVAKGREVYASQCASCHGDKLQGQANWRQRRANGRLPAPPHDETGHTWHHTDALLFAMTKHGPAALIRSAYQSDMPAYAGKITDKEIWAVLAYIKSRWPENIRKRQDEITRRSKETQ